MYLHFNIYYIFLRPFISNYFVNKDPVQTETALGLRFFPPSSLSSNEPIQEGVQATTYH